MTRSEIACLISASHAMQVNHYAPLLRACLKEQLTLVVVSRDEFDWLPVTGSIVVSRDEPVRFRSLGVLPEPALAVIGDDDDVRSGPEGWAVAGRLILWSRAALVHGATVATADDYRKAVDMAHRYRRVAMVESHHSKFVPWVTAFAQNGVPVTVIRPDARPSAPPPRGRAA